MSSWLSAPTSIDAAYVLEALLRHNYFPFSRKDREELPPILNTESLSPTAARKVVRGRVRGNQAFPGYDAVEYRLTRFNGVARSCSIPHPVAHAKLSLCVHDNWKNLEYTATNDMSRIRPTYHGDGRLIVMDYESPLEKSRKGLSSRFGRRFIASADIANFFPSIYS